MYSQFSLSSCISCLDTLILDRFSFPLYRTYEQCSYSGSSDFHSICRPIMYHTIQSSGYRPKMGLRSKWSISEVLLHIVITHQWRHLTDIAQEQPPMGPHHEKKNKTFDIPHFDLLDSDHQTNYCRKMTFLAYSTLVIFLLNFANAIFIDLVSREAGR